MAGSVGKQLCLVVGTPGGFTRWATRREESDIYKPFHIKHIQIMQAMWLLRNYTSGLGHCALSKQLRNSVQNSLNSVNSYIMEQHTAAQVTIHKQ